MEDRVEAMRIGDQVVGDLRVEAREGVVGDRVGRGVEERRMHRAVGHTACARVEDRSRSARAHLQALQQSKRGAVEERARGVGIGLVAHLTERLERLHGRGICCDRGARGDLEAAELRITRLSPHQQPHLIALALDARPGLARFRYGHPTLHAQVDQMLRAGRRDHAIEHAHHGHRRHGEGRAVITEPGMRLQRECLVVQALRVRALAARRVDGCIHRCIYNPDGDVRRFVDALAVDPEAARADEEYAAFIAADLEDLAGRSDDLVAGHDLPPVLPGVLVADGDGLEARMLHVLVQVRLDGEELQELEERFDTERARLHGVLEEVRLEEPLARVDVLLAPHEAQGLASTLRIAFGDAVDHQKHRLGEAQSAKVGTRTLGEIHAVLARALEERALFGGGREADLVLQRFFGEEAEHGLQLVGGRRGSVG